MSITNQLKTVVLLATLTALMLWIGSFWGQEGIIIALIFAGLLNFISYWFSDRIVLAMYRARPVTEHDQPRLYKLVREVTQLGNLPMPKVYIIPTQSPNAFATGRNPKNAVIACTQGIMDLLDDEELKGVIAHEASHIKNRDTLIQVVAATIAGVISYVAFMARWAAIFGGFGGGRDNSRGLELLFLAIVTPIVATLLQLAISRSREYLADASAAKMINQGEGLARALEKLERGIHLNPMRMGSKTTSAMFISNPFRGGLFNLFSTHPPIAERVKKLRAMDF